MTIVTIGSTDRHAAREEISPVGMGDALRADSRRFSLSITAMGSVVLNPRLYVAAGRKRAEVYIDEMGFLGEESRGRDGVEHDADDARSTHLVVNDGGASGRETNVVGLTRLIEKRDADDLLPAERMFDIEPVPKGSLEVSRFIARSGDLDFQHRVSLAMMRAIALKATEEGVPYIYAVVEEPLYRHFKAIGIPFRPVTDLQWVPEYRTENRVIRVVPAEVIPGIREKDSHRGSVTIAPFFEKELKTLGFGTYDANF